MKNLKMYLSAFAVLAIVGSALAFKGKAFGQGTEFCLASGTVTGACPTSDRVDFQVTPGATLANPCTGTDVAHFNSGGNCINNPTTDRYTTTAFGE
jgi:hypothetical protein